jgi:hypothetical protein
MTRAGDGARKPRLEAVGAIKRDAGANGPQDTRPSAVDERPASLSATVAGRPSKRGAGSMPAPPGAPVWARAPRL